MKDHEKRELVNAVTKVARDYGQTQQLRERIAAQLLPPLDDAARTAAALDIAMTTLGQIESTPRNAGARRNARATLRFIETQLRHNDGNQLREPGTGERQLD